MPNLLRQMLLQNRLMSTEGDPGGAGAPPVTAPVATAKTGNPLIDLPIDEVPDAWREHARELRRENASLRAITKTVDEAASQAKLDAAVKKALDEQQTKTQELVDGERKAAHKLIINSELRVIAARMGMVNLADLTLADTAALTLNADTGQVVGAEALLTAFKESRPYLFKEPASSTSHAGDPPPKEKPTPFNARTATPEERAAKAKEMGFKTRER